MTETKGISGSIEIDDFRQSPVMPSLPGLV
ncbi:hypothetical protein SAMN06265374_2197 [Roseibium denhamense]|uniref:Uncharacterized protein n=1 Tax=Roseibium denhamense TaxID=76305 RepID=A0ABY1P0V1_9HYPH|nr:hypothetical protein SAMN06265374_2197 [Roseibium denhamense]